MIIGKSLTALGGGGLKPEIRVTAKAGALLNLHYKDGSIILQTYQLGAEETQHTFVVNVSETAYVVEDVTNGKSVEVLVDAVAQYNVEIHYKLQLYRYGDPCEDVTGGWKKQGLGLNSTYNAPVAPTLTLNDYNMVISRDTITKSYDCGIVLPSNRIDFTDYSTIKIKWRGSGFGGGTLTYFRYRETIGSYQSDGTEMAGHNTDFTELVESYDISNVTGLQTVYISLYVRGTVTISEIWLE